MLENPCNNNKSDNQQETFKKYILDGSPTTTRNALCNVVYDL